jgi:hypothetical protein
VTRRRPRAAELTRHSDLKCAEDKRKDKLMEKLRSSPAVIAASVSRLQILSDDGKTAVSQQVAYMFGTTHMSMLWGIVFFSHQFGSFLGGWGAGRLYDVQGNYQLVWWISVGLGIFAAVIHWLIRERPVERLALAAVRS